MDTASKRLRSMALMASLTIGFALGACGGEEGSDGSGAGAPGEEAAVLETYDRFVQATVNKDTEAFCDLIDEESIQALKRVGGCTSFFTPDTFSGTEEDVAEQEVTDVEIRGDEATITTEYEGTEDTLELVREDGEWHAVLERTGLLE